jgi:hypothetical protein
MIDIVVDTVKSDGQSDGRVAGIQPGQGMLSSYSGRAVIRARNATLVCRLRSSASNRGWAQDNDIFPQSGAS